MKQVIQHVGSGELTVTEVPSPSLRRQGILVRTAASLVSAGTERMVVDFAEKNLIQKARARPDLVRQVVDKAQREGVLTTIETVRNRLDNPLPLGYSSAGVVTAAGVEATEFQAGDRVACAGGGYANHAELVYVPRTLAVRIPDSISCDAAAFATLGAIALQGIRQAEVSLGHNVAIVGLGLLGQLTSQLLKAAGCRVFGIDLNPQRVALARELGADDATTNDSALTAGSVFTSGRGFDAVLITADTKSSDPVVLAGDLARDRAIVVAVGAVGMEIPRKRYYEKELDFRLSRSYGPGRYDPDYEEKGHDYPYAYVRFTEQRNLETFIQLLAEGRINVAPLITHRFPIADAHQAYDLITGKTGEPFLGVLLTYDLDHPLPDRITTGASDVPAVPPSRRPAVPRIGVLGAGNFVTGALLPAMKDVPGLERAGIVSGSGLSARAAADRFGFAYCASDEAALLDDASITWLVVATRHDLHARQAIAGLRAGKDVFVEKPLALNIEELTEVARAQVETGRHLVVGFNRRFAPMVQEMHRFFAGRGRPLVATYRANAGAIPADHWTQDPATGGGRIVGEACHFIDLLQFLVRAPIAEVYAAAVQGPQGRVEDEVLVTLTFADGSLGSIIYAAGGDKAFGKERIEVIGDGHVAVLDDYRHLELVRDGKRTRRHERLRPNKGHRDEWVALAESVRTGADAPVPFSEIITTHLATFAALTSLRERRPVPVDTAAFWRDVAAP